MSSLALIMLVLVAECYCTPEKTEYGANTEFKVSFNFITGFKALFGQNENGTSFVDAEAIAGANATGQGSVTSYSGTNDNIVSKVSIAEGTIGIEAKPGINLQEGIDGNEPTVVPRFPVEKWRTGSYSTRVATGEDAKKIAADAGASLTQEAREDAKKIAADAGASLTQEARKDAKKIAADAGVSLTQEAPLNEKKADK